MDGFDMSSWEAPKEKQGGKNANGTLPFELLRELKVGTTVLRILDDRPIWRYQHFDGTQALLVCEGEAKDCLFCERQYGRQPSHFGFMNVLDKTDGRVKTGRFSQNLFKKLKPFVATYGDPRRYDVGITRTGLKRDTDYTIVKGDNQSPVEPDVMAQRYDLEKLLTPMSKQAQQQYLGGASSNGKDDLGK